MRKYSFLFVCAAVLISAFLALRLQIPPAVDSGDGDARGFSTERAMAHVREIAQKPHPAESEENARVRKYIISVLRDELGLEVEEQKGEIVRPARGERPERMYQLTNIYSRLPGSESGPGLLLVAHHDSVSRGPGAADDASNVAAILEAVRTIQVGGELKREIHILITDGEELGLLGAKMFIRDQAELLEQFAFVLNFEARGVSGPSFMFETSGANAEMISVFAKHSFHPIGNSLADFVYQRMPNNTDFTVFRKAGIPGLNFAFIDGAKHYHQASDSIENLDTRSMQQVGKLTVELCQHLGSVSALPETDPTAGTSNAVFFNLIGSTLIHYPMVFPKVLSVLLLMMLGFLPVLMRKPPTEELRSQWRAKSLALGIVRCIGITLLSIGLAILLIFLARKGRWSIDTVYMGAWSALLTSVLFAAFAHLRWGKKSPQSAEVLVVIAGILIGFLLPEGSYLFQWIAVFVGIGWLFQIFEKPSIARFFGLLGLLIAVFIHAPTVYYFFIAYPPAFPALIVLVVIDALLLATILMGINRTQIAPGT